MPGAGDGQEHEPREEDRSDEPRREQRAHRDEAHVVRGGERQHGDQERSGGEGLPVREPLYTLRCLLPCDGEPVDLQAGFTPLIKAKQLGEALGLRNLYLKNDCANPTWSFKDRVVAVAAAKALELGRTTLACSSTGNLANAVAARAAAEGIEAVVFCPADLEPEKIGATAVYGATIYAVDGSYDDCSRLTVELSFELPPAGSALRARGRVIWCDAPAGEVVHAQVHVARRRQADDEARRTRGRVGPRGRERARRPC